MTSDREETISRKFTAFYGFSVSIVKTFSFSCHSRNALKSAKSMSQRKNDHQSNGKKIFIEKNWELRDDGREITEAELPRQGRKN